MTKKQTPSNPAADLRRRAEAKVTADKAEAGETLSLEAAGRMFHDLQVHQIELEMQNEELRRAQEELEASRQRYFDLYDMAPVGYFTLSEAGLILEANLTAAALLGVTRDGLVNQPLTRFILRADQDIYYRHRRQLFETGSPQVCEMRMLRADTDPVWVRMEATVARDIDGTVHGRVVMSDITERKRAEETLRESIQRYELVLEGSAGGVWDWDILNKQVLFSSRWKAMRGYTDAEIGDNEEEWSSRIHPDDASRVMDAVLAHYAGKTAVFEEEYRVRCKNGSWIWVLDRGKAVRNEFGQVIRMAGSEIDITERKRAEEVRNFLAQTASPAPGKGFFPLLAEYLAKSLEMDFVCIDRLEGDGLTARTVAVWNNGKFEDNVTYALKDTPCGEVVGKKVCCFPASVCQFFPKDDVLRDLRAESYIGVTLWNHAGQPIGLIAVIGQRPLVNRARAEAVLKLVSERAAGELERQDAEQALKESEARLRGHVENSPLAVVEWNKDFLVTRWAGTAEQMFGYSAAETVGRPLTNLNLIYEADIPIVQGTMAKLTDGASRQIVSTNRNLTKDGRVIHCAWHNSVMLDEHGRLDSVLSLVLDITARKEAEAALSDSEARLKLAQTSAGAGMWDWDMATGKLEWSDELFALYGLDPGTATAGFDAWRSVIHPDDQAFAEKRIDEAIQNYTSLNSEYRIVLASGQVRWVNALGNTTYDDTGSPQRMSGICIDITERKQIEESLRESEERIQMALKLNNSFAFEWELATDRVLRSTSCGPILGLAGNDRVNDTGQSFFQRVHPDDRERFVAILGKVNPDAATYRTEYRVIRGDGVTAVLEEVARGFFDAAGALRRLVGVTTDITERKEAETALLASEERYRAILHTALDGFVVVDMQGRLLDVNEAYCRLSGYSRSELLDKRISDLEAVLTSDDIAARIQRITAKGEDRFETRHRRKDGGFLDLEVSVQYRAFEGGQFVAFLHDITDRKRTEREVRRSAEQYAILSDTASRLLVSKNPQALVKALCRKVMKHLDCDVFFNFLVDTAADRLHLNAWGGIPEEQALKLEWLDYGTAVCGCAARDGCRIVAEHIPTTPDERTELVKSFGVKAYACHPLVGPFGMILGTLSFGTRSRETFGEDELSMMKTVADYVATALTRLRYEKSLSQQNTDLKAVRKTLENEQRRLKGVMNVLPVGMAIVDGSGGTILSNKAFDQVWGSPRPKTKDIKDYAAYKAWWVDTGKPVEPEEWASAKAVRNAESVFNQYLKIQRFDGSFAYVLNSATPLLDADGRIVAGAVAIQDVTALRNAQEVLRQRQEDLDRAQAVGNIGSWRLDTQRNVLTWSAEAHRIFGIPEGTPLTYESFVSTIHPDDRGYVDARWKAALDGQPYDIEHRIVVGDTIRWVREKAYLEFDAEGELAGGFGITQDITERKRMELELRQARDLLENRVQERTRDLAQTTLQLRALATELILTEERERREVASALHDSLGPLLSFSKRELGTLRKTIPAQFAETLDHIRGHISQAIDQTRSLTIDLSPPTLYTLGLGHALEELAERFAAEHNFRCVFQNDGSIPPLPDNIQVLLYRSVRELFVNIVKHAQATSVRLSLSKEKNHIRIAVEDDGVGIKEPALRSADGQRTGFGLFTIRQRLEQAGGRLEIQSPNGKGTLVTVQVPLKTTKPSTRRNKT
jgi:PAS domain S-box-containing protein